MNILEMIQQQKEQQVQQQPPPQPVPTEKSQIVIAFATAPSLVMRFNTVKNGEKALRRLNRAWLVHKNSSTAQPLKLHEIEADMFSSTIDLTTVISISFIDHAKRVKFIPQ